ncbi:heptaprenyl diphosphate synthase component I [bacterium BMS3Bbin11]|nr:heptaprenyl diphosphate synthase component I [bacterium BMS3Abin11]GBE45299.1 heptaprenyl diphosphate synthase component I [bacterium BMS3Bbin11]GMT39763.1 MAG: heptaprenyl diphosphate synthase subunit I [bacterium]HDH08692.1 Gx transporter family protein [Gammaproteobacteria bacterium]HDH16402.1 Gx transporter family protein [Gammaproteobacteria bacterium]
MTRQIEITEEDRKIAAFAALAIVIHVLESSFPSPVPGIKPGLANIVTLLVLFRYGWRFAVWVSLLRVTAGSLLLGTFMSPTFFLSLSGALASLLAMLLLWTGMRPWVGMAGVSILASISHVMAQLLVAWWLFIPHRGILALTPILIAAGVFFGLFNAIIASSIEKRLVNTV